jgi:lipid A ethanolaminephosphotransferase
MLSGLDDYIATHEGDITIVLHQMGNHGPAYYKRYPQEFERHTPACQSNQLESCAREEIVNAYDNAVMYSDYFLFEVIEFLKPYDGEFSTGMFYMADHGESLGEMGLYLHGLPYALAPEAQTHVASFLWLGAMDANDDKSLKARAREPLSHDNYFHTVLGMMDVETAIYDPALDIVSGVKW